MLQIIVNFALSLCIIAAGIGVLFLINWYRIGWLFNKHAWWVGAHYSPYNKRLCVNILPCCTIWFIFPGGTAPGEGKVPDLSIWNVR